MIKKGTRRSASSLGGEPVPIGGKVSLCGSVIVFNM